MCDAGDNTPGAPGTKNHPNAYANYKILYKQRFAKLSKAKVFENEQLLRDFRAS